MQGGHEPLHDGGVCPTDRYLKMYCAGTVNLGSGESGGSVMCNEGLSSYKLMAYAEPGESQLQA
jgi:hypothetical protein